MTPTETKPATAKPETATPPRAARVSKKTAFSIDEKKAKLLKLRAELDAKLAKITARESAQTRKDDTHEKVLIGAALLADIAVHSETRELVQTILKRAVTKDTDKVFLRLRKWHF
jgi:hypothetical protein